jgi:predicted nucleotidyltransferase
MPNKRNSQIIMTKRKQNIPGRVTLKGIEKDFEGFKEKTLGILLFGSRAEGTHHARSDIDVCLVAGEYDPDKLFQEVLKTNLTAKYDVKIFELLPMKIKGSILWQP